MKIWTLLLAALPLIACSSPQNKETEPPAEEEEASGPIALSCYFPDIADAENVQLHFSSTEGSNAVKLVIETDVDGESVGREVYEEISLSNAEEWPLGTYTATLGNKEAVLKLTKIEANPTETAQFYGVYTSGERKDVITTCYTLEQDE